METIDPFSLAQIIGYVALVASILSYMVKDDNKMKLAFTGANMIWIVHYFMIGTVTSAIATIIVTFRNVISLDSHKFTPRRRFLSLMLIETALVVTAILTWENWQQATPFIPTMIGSYGIFYLHGVRLRAVFFLCDIFWLVNALVVGSIGGLIYAVGSLGMNALTMSGMAKDLKRAEMARIENLP